MPVLSATLKSYGNEKNASKTKVNYRNLVLSKQLKYLSKLVVSYKRNQDQIPITLACKFHCSDCHLYQAYNELSK